MDIKSTLENVIDKESSFSFEMKILNHLREATFSCIHAGVYLDPYQKVNREFDIRAFKDLDECRHLRLAVECKNISPELPLVIHSTFIEKKERVHSLVVNYSGEQEKNGNTWTIPVSAVSFLNKVYPHSFCHEVSPRHLRGHQFASIYSDFELVGRSMDKLKVKIQGKEKVYCFSDEEVYPKFSQCQNSLVGIIE